MTAALVIADTVVRADADARYCLNDLHKAAGGKARHQPARWLRSKQAQELVAEVAVNYPDLGISPVVQVKGNGGGTFACDDLLIAYANWISAKFYLRVIRAFKGQLGIEVKSRDLWIRRKLALEKRSSASKDRASTGASWMAKHRHALPQLRAEEALINQHIQPRLFLEEA